MRCLVLLLSLSAGLSAHAETLTFAQTVALVAQSPAVRSAAQGAELARRGRDIDRSPVSLSLSSGVQAGTVGDAAAASDVIFDPVTLAATLNVVPVGPSATAAERADAGVTLAETTYADVLEDTLLSAVEGHLNALRNADRTAALREQVEVARFALAAVRARLRAGAAGEDELLAAQLALAGAESDLATSLREEAEALGTLTLTLGVDVSGVRGPVPTSTVGPYDLEAQLGRRGDVRAATSAVREAELAAADARFATLPTGTLGVGYSRSAGGQNVALGASIGSESGFQPSLSASYQPFADDATGSGFSASLGVSVPLDPATPTVLDTAALGVTQAQADLDNVRALARLEVSSRERELAAAESGLGLAARQLELSRRLREGVRARFELGLVTPLELKQAAAAQLEAELTQDVARDAVLLARLRLARALALKLEDVLGSIL